MKKDKVVLAYSGGVDTSVGIKWLQEEKGLDVIALCVDIGQGAELEQIKNKALKIGAVKSVVVDARDKFCNEFLAPAIRANTLYEGQYVHSTSLNRPCIVEVMIDVARKEGAKYISHGATGKGNDQVRFEVSVMALAPELEVIAFAREWGMTRDEEIEYAKKHRIPVPVTKKSPYSIDLSIWGKSTECGILEDPWAEPPDDSISWVRKIEKTPQKPEYVEIKFDRGIPVALDGRRMKLFTLIDRLNGIAARHGIGHVDMVENRLVGIKSRETYEAPAATVILRAHRDLESLILTRDTMHFKGYLEDRYSDLVYDGLWHSELKRHLDAFFESVQEKVSGTVRLKLFKGNAKVVGRKSPNSLYSRDYATYDRGDKFDHAAGKGFITIWGLPVKVDAIVQEKNEKKSPKKKKNK